ncbi:hypothetical protein LTR49_028786, partial [Elasticomyces elasticus]
MTTIPTTSSLWNNWTAHSAKILACITCEDMILVADPVTDDYLRKNLIESTVMFAPTICKWCEDKEMIEHGLESRPDHRNIVINHDMIMMWGPYTAVSAFEEGMVILDKTGSRMMCRS